VPNARVSPSRAHFTGEFVRTVGAQLAKLDDSKKFAIGLVFGKIDSGIPTLQLFSHAAELSAEQDVAAHERLESALTRILTEWKSSKAPQSLELIGWCCLQPTDEGASTDYFAVHGQHFRRASDIFLNLRSHPDGISGHLYARMSELPLSTQDAAIGVVRTRGDHPPDEPVAVTIYAPAAPELYLNVYEALNLLDEDQTREEWRQRFAPIPRLLGWGKAAWHRFVSRRRFQAATDATDYEEKGGRRLGPWAASLFNRTRAVAATLGRAALRPITTATRSNIHTTVLAGLLLLLSGFGVGLIHFRLLSSELAGHHLIPSERSEAELGMRIDRQSDGILLRWNQKSASIASTKTAVLEVEDGGQKRTLALDMRDLAEGSLFYRPSSKDVSFRLTLHLADGSTASDSIQVGNSLNDLAKSEQAIDHKPNRTVDNRGTAKRSTQTLLARTTQNHTTTMDSEPAGRPLAESTNSQIHASNQQPLPPARIRTQAAERAAQENNLAAQQPPRKRAKEGTSVASASSRTASEHASPSQSADVNSISASRGRGTSPAVQPGPLSDPLQNYTPARPADTVAVNASLFEPSVMANINQIQVLVTVDETGRVTRANISNSSENMSPLVADAVLAAARQWTFYPAKMHGKNIASKHVIVFRFAHS
jgi:TonB family protein